MNSYNVLSKQVYESGDYAIVPIRSKDRYDIMKWRNEQLYHLRQKKKLTKQDQDRYFDHLISKLFEQENPSQILFSYLENDRCIGYGGVVHINWEDRHAEISFVMDTALENDYFDHHWQMYLPLIQQVAFQELKLHKLFTYAFDLRPHMYACFEAAGFIQEARLKDHIFYENKFVDVVIHGKINPN